MNLISFRRGQSIIEALVSIGILTVGFLGILGLLSQSIFLSRVTSDQLKATYLASEGIEVVKSLVDHDVYARLATPPSGVGWGSCCAVGNYQIDSTSKALISYPNPVGTPRLLHFDPATDLYNYTGPVTTHFNRWVSIARTANPSELVVNAHVSWVSGIVSQNLNLEDHFYNWHP